MSTHIRLDADVKAALSEFCDDPTVKVSESFCASVAVAEWLRNQGKRIDYPYPNAAKRTQRKTAA